MLNKLLPALLFLALAACGRAHGPTEICTETMDCADGLSCIPLQNSINGTCTGSPGSSCTKTCANDAECEALEPGLKCVGTCDNMMLCTRLAE